MNTALLLSMPFGPLERQALGLSVLKPQLERRGIACSIRYLTFPFAEFIGYENYHWISNTVPYTAFAGDWVFRRALYGRHDHEEHAYVQDILRHTWKLGEEDIDRIFRIRAFVEPFMEYCVQRFQWGEYGLVGLTSTFEQNLASLALAKRIKALFPHLSIVFGGANWEGEMGRELMRQFPFVDYVCSGEADDSFPALAHALFHAHPTGRRLSSIGGIAWREGEEIRHTGQAPLIRHMDTLPVPDYEDYFDNLEDSTVSASVVPVLLLETSRGCWWGEKAHCTFCGLNGGAMEFRSKSATRSLRELESLSSRWQIDFIEVVDNIMDMKAFQEFLPTLAQQGAPYRLFYEVKSNLTKAHVRVLAAAGVFRIQPGIESMNDHVLHLMRKGTTALRNIQLLKWCKEYGITVDWNILYGFPGETAQDYQSMLSLLPAIRFLGAPTACGPIRLDRFSPYFNDPEQFGLTNVQANPVYRHLYPFPQDRLNRIAYFFDYEYRNGLPADEYAHELIRYCDEWRQQPESGCVWSLACEPGELVLLDTRTNAAQTEFRLSGMEAEAYRYCDDLRREQAIFRHLREHFPGTIFSGQDVRRFLQSLCACGLMVTDGDHYLSLAIPYPPSGTPSCPVWADDDGHRSAIQGDSLRSRHELPMVAFTPSNGG
jgi:ribosomal peptide maturation radical SAM protein 1